MSEDLNAHDKEDQTLLSQETVIRVQQETPVRRSSVNPTSSNGNSATTMQKVKVKKRGHSENIHSEGNPASAQAQKLNPTILKLGNNLQINGNMANLKV